MSASPNFTNKKQTCIEPDKVSAVGRSGPRTRMFDDARTRYEAQHQPAVVRRMLLPIAAHWRPLPWSAACPWTGPTCSPASRRRPPKTVYQLSRSTSRSWLPRPAFPDSLRSLPFTAILSPIVIDDILVLRSLGGPLSGARTRRRFRYSISPSESCGFQQDRFTIQPSNSDRGFMA
jgi:hypothetical protein